MKNLGWLYYAGAGIVCLSVLMAGLAVWRYKQQVNMYFRPVPDEYEVLPEQVDMIDIIGSGAHGKVFKAVSCSLKGYTVA